MSEWRDRVGRFRDCGVLVIGDLILDHYVWGRVTRVSPEAPVPVVEITREDFHLGGAANVVNNVRSLGSRVYVAGAVGSDLDGQTLKRMVEDAADGSCCVMTDNGRPTTTKMRIIAQRQQIVRADREETSDLDDEVVLAMTDYVREVLPEVDAIILSDYGKGAVTPRLVSTVVTQVRAFSASRPRPIAILVDPKGRDYEKYRGVDVIKPNLLEAHQATGIDVGSEAGLRAAGLEIQAKTRCKAVLITEGERGMTLFQESVSTQHFSTRMRETFEVSGAGDTVSASLAVALAAGEDLASACRIANAAAWVVVGKVGIACVTPEELIEALEEAEEEAGEGGAAP